MINLESQIASLRIEVTDKKIHCPIDLNQVKQNDLNTPKAELHSTCSFRRQKISSLKKIIIAQRITNSPEKIYVPQQGVKINELKSNKSIKIFKSKAKIRPSIKRYARQKNDVKKNENLVTLVEFLSQKKSKDIHKEKAQVLSQNDNTDGNVKIQTSHLKVKDIFKNPNVDHSNRISSHTSSNKTISESVVKANAKNRLQQSLNEEKDIQLNNLMLSLEKHLHLFYMQLNGYSLPPNQLVLFESEKNLVKQIISITKKRGFHENLIFDHLDTFDIISRKNPSLQNPHFDIDHLKQINYEFFKLMLTDPKSDFVNWKEELKSLDPLYESLNNCHFFNHDNNKICRPYCDHYHNQDIEILTLKLLQTLSNFYAKRLNDVISTGKPLNTVRKRLVYGLKEIEKCLFLGKIKCVIIAIDLEDIPGPGGLNEIINGLIQCCRHFGVPIIFSANKKKMSKYVIDAKYINRVYSKLSKNESTINQTEAQKTSIQKTFTRQFRKINVSAIGILNMEGAEKIYKELIELVQDCKINYLKKILTIIQEIL